MTPRRKVQGDATGCGIACAAMLSNKSYAHVRKRAIEMEIFEHHRPYYTRAWQVSRLLRDLGISHSRVRNLSKWASVTRLSIVAVNYNKEADEWHWVVYVPNAKGGYVLDPHPTVETNRRTDFHLLRPRSYIPISAP